MPDSVNRRFQMCLLDTGPLRCGTSLAEKLVEFLDLRRGDDLQNDGIAFADHDELVALAQSEVAANRFGYNDLPLGRKPCGRVTCHCFHSDLTGKNSTRPTLTYPGPRLRIPAQNCELGPDKPNFHIAARATSLRLRQKMFWCQRI